MEKTYKPTLSKRAGAFFVAGLNFFFVVMGIVFIRSNVAVDWGAIVVCFIIGFVFILLSESIHLRVSSQKVELQYLFIRYETSWQNVKDLGIDRHGLVLILTEPVAIQGRGVLGSFSLPLGERTNLPLNLFINKWQTYDDLIGSELGQDLVNNLNLPFFVE